MEELDTYSTTTKILTTIFLASTGYIVVSFLYQIIHYRYFHPLKDIPGPFWATVTRIWGAYHNFLSDETLLTYAWLKKHNGSISSNPLSSPHSNYANSNCCSYLSKPSLSQFCQVPYNNLPPHCCQISNVHYRLFRRSWISLQHPTSCRARLSSKADRRSVLLL